MRPDQLNRSSIQRHFAPASQVVRLCASGLTLLELVLVLVILAVLATVAVEMIEPQVDQSRFEATRQTIQNVNRAIVAENTNTDGTHFYSGFFVDLGGLPRARADAFDTNVLTLGDLWVNPGVATFSLRPAVGTNVANIVDGSNVDRDDQAVVADSEVTLGTGWRGPYLQLPIGADELADGWGSPLVSLADGSDFSHLRGFADTDIVAAGQTVFGVRSLGRDRLLGGLDYDTDLPTTLSINDGKLFGTVTGSASINSSQGVTSDKIVVHLFYPDGIGAVPTGLIRVERATISSQTTNNETGKDEFEFRFLEADGVTEVLFPVGPRAIRAYFDDQVDTSGDFSDGTNDPKKSPIRYFTILPTTNGGISLIIEG